MENVYLVSLLLLILLSACTKQPTPEKLLLSYIKDPTYAVLSQRDKDFFSEIEFNEYIQQNPKQLTDRRHKFYMLEKFLKEESKVSIISSESDGEITKITVREEYPVALSKLKTHLRMIDKGFESTFKDSLDHMNNLLKKSALEPDLLHIAVFDSHYEVDGTGLFIDVARVKKELMIQSEIDELRAQIATLVETDFASLMDFAPGLDASRESLLNQLATIEKLKGTILEIEDIHAKIKILDPNTLQLPGDKWLLDARNFVRSTEFIANTKDCMSISNLVMEKAQGGGYGVAGSYEYNCDTELESYLVFFRLFDGNSEIGTSNGNFDDLYKGKSDQFIFRISDPFIGRNTDRVEIQPYMVKFKG